MMLRRYHAEGEATTGVASPEVDLNTKPTGTPGASENPLDKATNPEIVAFAAANGIDLGEATKKADMLAVIAKATVSN